MAQILIDPLNSLQSLSQTLFLTLSPSQTKPPQPPQISSFLSVDEQLSHALSLAHNHQVKQRWIQALKEEVLSLEKAWREVIELLEGGRISLGKWEERIRGIQASSGGE
jgi:mediator of RNA polymerase II transcription subunit 4